MELKETIKKRHSTRSFKSKSPDWRDILEALHSSQYAPMAGNVFSLKFVIIEKYSAIEEIAKWSEQDFIAQAKYVVAFVSNPDSTKSYPQNSEKFMHQQAGAAIQNFLLHLTEIGLSTCWIGHFNEEKVKKLLGIPEDKKIEALFPIGYEKTTPKIKPPKGDLYNILYFENWGNKRMKPQKKIEARSPEGY